ncbi:hypothetical protein F5878DRAFT_629415 [Lentinula raphanica]|uniref:Uncharacterized protein n=1 Tax=Lentinula raphanica TaxID=153919 RepID=A0AA38P241_9AGAR|nr:hypothetical protein F5878DRAFT_629415 [Lentinula raphanica]
MKRSPWNRAVASVLAAKAFQLVADNPEYYGRNKKQSEWEDIINTRLYRVFLDVAKAKQGTLDYEYEVQKQQSKKRRLRQYTHERRTKIATLMITVMQDLADEVEYRRWSEILQSLDRLGVAGTSDSEDIMDTQGQQGVIVYEPNFRHAWFRTLFHEVDRTPQAAPYLFSKFGRKRLPRISGTERVERAPPANLPSSYYRPEYLEKMRKGLTPTIAPTVMDQPLPSLPNYESIQALLDG